MGTHSRGHFDSVKEVQFDPSNLLGECMHDDCRFTEEVLQGSSNQFNGHRFPDVLLQGRVDGNGSDGENQVACDYFDGVYDYIKQILMEEDDLEHRPCMFQDCSALQAAEKYFYDALSDKDSSSLDANTLPSFAVDHQDFVNHDISASNFGQWSLVDQQICGEGLWNDGILDCSSASPFQLQNINVPDNNMRNQEIFQASGVEENFNFFQQIKDSINLDQGSNLKQGIVQDMEQRRGDENSPNVDENSQNMDDSRRKKNHERGDGNDDSSEDRSSKLLASCEEESEQMEKYDKAFLCHQMNPGFYDRPPVPVSRYEETSEDEVDSKYSKQPEVKRGRPKGTKKHQQKQNTGKEMVDLRTLLTRCATAASCFDTTTAQEVLMKIRQHSSPHGDANERLAHCFANALEARLASTGSMLYTASATRRIPAAQLLKSFQTYVTACPFKRMSNIFANKSIASYTREAIKIHIIDFGILYGFQWPCIIQGISLRPGGPPVLKITGIDFPQPGFKPAERVEQTGRRLKSYCKRFNVPFEYNAVAKKWDDICREDLKIERDEMLVANCLYRLRQVPDESAGVNSPRDGILKLIKKINPDLFVHGVVNGTYNTPFFASRFKEALFHYSSFFDLLEATVPREDQDRLLYEREVFGREIMNIVACEGAERIERPETYKQWHVRNQRAGFTQIPLNWEIMKEIKTKVRKGYHNDFLLEEDSEWMLQGWKGRVMYALSCWKPSED